MEPVNQPPIRLSICIATYARAAFIRQTLESILLQADLRVEVLIVDGASPDDTELVVGAMQAKYPRLVYHREQSNSGVDRDFDKAVRYARGDYCWLMSDDDILVPDAVATVINNLRDDPELVIVNAEIRNKDLSTVLKSNQLGIVEDCEFSAQDHQRLFAATANYLSFIGAVVIRRATWLARERDPYFGSLFVHMGVIFQLPALGRSKVIARPLIRIRYGNALWTARAFQIWMFNWPRLIWSFDHLDMQARQNVSPQFPASSLRTLLWYRAIGAYGPHEKARLLRDGDRSHIHSLAGIVGYLPVKPLNAALAIYCYFSRHGDARMKLYDLSRVSVASHIASWLAR